LDDNALGAALTAFGEAGKFEIRYIQLPAQVRGIFLGNYCSREEIIAHIDRVTPLARQARQLSEYPVGNLACFNVDFSGEFRYCLETGADPTPASELSTLRLSVPVTETSNDVYGELAVAGDTVIGSPTEILTAVQGALEAHDPDVLVCSTSEIVPTLYEMATHAGIVDSIWVTPNPDVNDDDREDLEALATAITERVEIRLEHEAHYGRVAFVPQRESDAGTLTKYFGKVAGDDEFKIRGTEARQRSTPPFIEDAQRDCLERFDATRSPDVVLDCLQDAIKRLHAGTVPVVELVERNRVSKPLEGYTQNTQNVAALKRAREQDLAVRPGQDIEYVVVDDEKRSRERVALAHEEIESYDPSYYETGLIRAVESVLSPLGWDRSKIRRELAETRVTKLSAFTETDFS